MASGRRPRPTASGWPDRRMTVAIEDRVTIETILTRLRLEPHGVGQVTGAPRSAAVVASPDVERCRLDKAGLEDELKSRPALAEGMPRVLVERQHHNEDLHDAFSNA